MRSDVFSEAMSEVDDRYYLEAIRYQPMRKKNRWLKWGAAAACLAIVAYAGIRLLWPSSGSATNLPMLTISENAAGMGFEGYMAYDVSELVSANPWREDAAITTLPVYRNRVDVVNGQEIASIADFEQMHELLSDIVGRLGLDIDAQAVTAEVPNEASRQAVTEKLNISSVTVSGGGAARLQVETEGMNITVDQFLTAEITFAPAVQLPSAYHFTEQASYKELTAVAEYLMAEYADLLGMEHPQISISGGDYNTLLQQRYSLAFYDAADSVTWQIINYNFHQAAFYGDAEGKLYLFRSFQPDLSEKIGDYPIITPQEAAQLLANGNYTTSVPYEMPGMDDVKKVELIYRTGALESCYMPYYRFYVELPEDGLEDGLKTYGAYYVPAVSGAYLTNMPAWDGHFN